VGNYGRGVDGVERRLVIRNIPDREVGQSRDADGWGLNEGRYRNGVYLWGGDGFEWRVLRILWCEVPARKPQGCGNGSCSRVFLVYPGREYRWGREALPSACP